MRSGRAKEHLRVAGTNATRGVGDCCRLPDDDPWQDRNTNCKHIRKLLAQKSRIRGAQDKA
jgi:hypothetical protein